jgi:hypothetical protein|tara:strand:+ start:3340 stop:3579 length:240 start_codon:yes stop_codon:yes gene_type:complete
MKQGDLFDDLYIEQPADVSTHLPGHMNCEVLYPGAIEGVMKQRLVTYCKDEHGNVKRIEKIRNFSSKTFHDYTTVEVLR